MLYSCSPSTVTKVKQRMAAGEVTPRKHGSGTSSHSMDTNTEALATKYVESGARFRDLHKVCFLFAVCARVCFVACCGGIVLNAVALFQAVHFWFPHMSYRNSRILLTSTSTKALFIAMFQLEYQNKKEFMKTQGSGSWVTHSTMDSSLSIKSLVLQKMRDMVSKVLMKLVLK